MDEQTKLVMYIITGAVAKGHYVKMSNIYFTGGAERWDMISLPIDSQKLLDCFKEYNKHSHRAVEAAGSKL